MPLRTILYSSTCVISSPLKITLPEVGFTWPMMASHRVDLPAPFGPIRTLIDVGISFRLMPLRALNPSKLTITSSTDSSGDVMLHLFRKGPFRVDPYSMPPSSRDACPRRSAPNYLAGRPVL